MVINTKGVILRKRSIGEKDAILTLLTDDLGLIEVSAHGIKSSKSKISASCQQFYYSEFTLYFSKNRYHISTASVIHSFYDLRCDVIKLALADYFASLICFLEPSLDTTESARKLFLNTLYFLTERKRELSFIKCVFEMRLLTLSGFMPDLVGCYVCHRYEKSLPYIFDVKEGTIFCSDCRAAINSADGIIMMPPVLSALRHIIYSDDSKLFLFHLADKSLSLLEHVSEKYVLTHVERSFKPLELYHSLLEGIAQNEKTPENS